VILLPCYSELKYYKEALSYQNRNDLFYAQNKKVTRLKNVFQTMLCKKLSE